MVESMIATPVAELLQVPTPLLVYKLVFPLHTVFAPLIAAGGAMTVISSFAKQPVGKW